MTWPDRKHRYTAFGLGLASDLALPELSPAPDSHTPIDVVIYQGLGPKAPDPEIPPRRKSLRISAESLADFDVEEGRRITYHRAAGILDEEIRLFLLGSCFGALLQQRGFLVLHGNAVSTDGETCKIIMGHSGAGKSTAAAWHYLEGDRILADDICAITMENGTPMVIPSFPQIKLWQGSLDLLGLNAGNLRPIHAKIGKFALPIGNRFTEHPLPLCEVIELDPTAGDSRPILGMEKVRCLLRHSYRYNFLEAMGMAGEYTRKIMGLAERVEAKTGGRKILQNAPIL